MEGAQSAEKVDISNAALSDGEVKRIFIGGVGAAVTSADMVKTFSPLGSVHAVEFVRTDGRNFAFMDFEPSSAKSMASLFSIYNGCKWKGGKLKLEMAKEHYLTRLKREWEKDAQLASAPPSTEENLNIVRLDFPHQENSQIRIFFPKLRKVKSLPLKGTGKHKYSFQRIEVSPVPIHFCDCEEHTKALETTGHKYFSPPSIVVHEKERNIINIVLNKLIGADTDDKTTGGNMQAASGPNISSPSDEDVHCKAQEVSDTDDDNLVMNFGAGAGNDILFMQSKGAATTLTGQEPIFANPKLAENMTDCGKRKKSKVNSASSIKPNKRAHSTSADDLSKREPAPAIAAGEGSSPVPLKISKGPALMPQLPAEIPPAETQYKPDLGTESAGSHSWVQKTSWKNLVGEGTSSFSLSTLLSGIAAIPANSNASDSYAHPTAKKGEAFGEKSKRVPQNVQITTGTNPKAPPIKDSLCGMQERTVESKANIAQEQRKDRAVFSSGGVCPFMRSAESEHQWAKTKVALSRFIRSKSNEENSSKFTKGMAPGKR